MWELCPAEVGGILASFDAESVHQVWQRALGRRKDDPEGAITAARTLVETVCKHILDEAGIVYDANDDLPKLYRRVSLHLQLAPSQHSEEDFKRILGGCTSVVEGLGGLRNRLGDAHGTGRRQVKPSARHAELAVNLAGAMTVFLVASWNAGGGRALGTAREPDGPATSGRPLGRQKRRRAAGHLRTNLLLPPEDDVR